MALITVGGAPTVPLSEGDQIRLAECFGTLAKTLNVHQTGKRDHADLQHTILGEKPV
jgi:hypothetical protein